MSKNVVNPPSWGDPCGCDHRDAALIAPQIRSSVALLLLASFLRWDWGPPFGDEHVRGARWQRETIAPVGEVDAVDRLRVFVDQPQQRDLNSRRLQAPLQSRVTRIVRIMIRMG